LRDGSIAIDGVLPIYRWVSVDFVLAVDTLFIIKVILKNTINFVCAGSVQGKDVVGVFPKKCAHCCFLALFLEALIDSRILQNMPGATR
jgi:hypothetical protein